MMILGQLLFIAVGIVGIVLILRSGRSKPKAPKSNLSYQPLADAPDFWTEDDSRTLTSFFNSESGQKLKLRLTNYVLRSAVAATAKEDNLEYHCGRARGVAETVQEIEFHLATPELERTEEEENNDLLQEAMA